MIHGLTWNGRHRRLDELSNIPKNDRVTVYSLQNHNFVIDISDYQLSKAIPKKPKSSPLQIEDVEK